MDKSSTEQISQKEAFLLLANFIQKIDQKQNPFSLFCFFQDYVPAQIQKNCFLGKEFSYLYLIAQKVKDQIKPRPEITRWINKLNQLYHTYPKDSFESFVLNDNIFILHVLNGKPRAGFRIYLENLLQKDFNLGIQKGYKQFLSNFIRLISAYLDKDVLFKTLKDIIDKDFLINLRRKQRRSVINWLWNCLWGDELFLRRKQEQDHFYPIFKQTLDHLIKRKKIDEVMHFSMFIVNTFHEWHTDAHKNYAIFQRDITEPSSRLYEEFLAKIKLPPCKKEISSQGKIKIALVRPNLGYWSPFIIEYSLVKKLISDQEFNKKYEIGFYSMDFFELWNAGGDAPRCLELIKKAKSKYSSPVRNFRKYGYYNNHLKKVLTFRKKMIERDIDIILYPDHHSCGELLFLSRSAPRQIYWSHNNFYFNVKNIDQRICHFSPAQDNPFKWDVFSVPMEKEFLIGTPEEKKQGEQIKKQLLAQYGQDTVILGTIGRLIKIDSDDYLKVIAEIMRENPNTIYLACGSGNIDSIKEKLKKYDIDEKRFIFTGFVNPHVYGWVIDVWLDSFPLRSGHARGEYVAKGGFSIIYLPNFNVDKLHPMYQQIDYPIAPNINKYLFFTNKAIKSITYRNFIRKIQQKDMLSFFISRRTDKFIMILSSLST